MESQGSGGTGRARGRAQPSSAASLEESLQWMQAIRISPTGSGNGSGNGNGNGSNGEGTAVREMSSRVEWDSDPIPRTQPTRQLVETYQLLAIKTTTIIDEPVTDLFREEPVTDLFRPFKKMADNRLREYSQRLKNIELSISSEDSNDSEEMTETQQTMTSTPPTARKSIQHSMSANRRESHSSAKRLANKGLTALPNSVLNQMTPNVRSIQSPNSSTVIKNSLKRKTTSNGLSLTSSERKSYIPEQMERTGLDCSPYALPFTPKTIVNSKRQSRNDRTYNNRTVFGDNTAINRLFKSTTTQTNDSLKRMNEICEQTFNVHKSVDGIDSQLNECHTSPTPAQEVVLENNALDISTESDEEIVNIGVVSNGEICTESAIEDKDISEAIERNKSLSVEPQNDGLCESNLELNSDSANDCSVCAQEVETEKSGDKSEHELQSLVNRQKRRINCLETDLLRSKLLSIRYQKCLLFLDKFSQNSDYLEIEKEIIDFNVINDKLCFVSLNELNINESNQLNPRNEDLNESNEELTQTEDNLKSGVLSAEEVSDNESEGFDDNIVSNNEFKFITEIKGKISLNKTSFESNDEEISKRCEEMSENGFNEHKIKSELSDSSIPINSYQSSDESNVELNNRHQKSKIDSKANKNKTDCSEQLRLKHKIESKTNKINDKKQTKATESVEKSGEKFVCNWFGCRKSIESNSDLLAHKARHKMKKFRCDWNGCEFTTTILSILIQHKNRHLGKYLCDFPDCGFKAGREYSLNRHKLSHSDDKPINCGKQFKEYGLDVHQKAVHLGLRPDLEYMECDESGCDFKTKLMTNLMRHKRTHTKPYVCTECPKRFAQIDALNKHLTSHSDDKPFECLYCNMRFKSRSAHRYHTNAHEGTDLVVCDVAGCGQSFAANHQLTAHQKTHSKPFRCLWAGCEQSFASNSVMKYHFNSHSVNTHLCVWSNCGKSYATRTALHIHNTQHKRYMYSCLWPECDYTTNNTIRLKSHKKMHSNLVNSY